MNVFRKYTRQSLRRNPARTLVTVIGIVLSMSLFTAVIEGAYSGLQYLIRGEVEVSGAWHGFYYSLDSETKDRVLADSAIAGAATWQQVGWADTGGNASFPYLLIEDAGDNLSDLLSIRLTDGSRMPENENELLLPVELPLSLFPDDEVFRVGDTVTLDVGRLLGDGENAEEMYYFSSFEELEVTDATPRTYTVVGTYVNFSFSVTEDKWIAFTKGGGTGDWRVFFTLKNVGQFNAYRDAIDASLSIRTHPGLLRYYGVMGQGLTNLLYGFAGVLVFLVAFGSVSLIYNSFSISVSERTRQFGLLKSVGATKKQIRSTVLYEALLLSAVGIPIGLVVGCTGIGITLWALRDFFYTLYAAGNGMSTRIGLVPAPGPLALSAAICLVTVLISAWIPAQRAIRLNAIDAIRQSGDVIIKPHEVRVSPITAKLFGFEGMMAAKSFKRSRRRYRSTVFSLFLSVTLFISASSFCAYVTDTVEIMASDDSTEELIYTDYTDTWDEQDPEAVLALLSGTEGVTLGGFYGIRVREFAVEPEWIKEKAAPWNGAETLFLYMVLVDDATFRQLCVDNGLDPEDYFDPSDPAALLYNRVVLTDEDHRRVIQEPFDVGKLPFTLYDEELRSFEGYQLIGTETGANGETLYRYYPESYLEEFSLMNSGSGDLDPSRAMLVPERDARVRHPVPIRGAVRKCPFFLSQDNVKVILPYSMRAAFFPDGLSGFRQVYAFQAEDHTAAFEAMSRLIAGAGMEGSLSDSALNGHRTRMVVTIVNVFAYGFITLISLIAAANVFNTISTNVSLRRREFAMLRSIGLSQRGFQKMMRYECLIYGLRGLLWGLPASVVMTYVIYRVTSSVLTISFYIPWYSVAIAVGSVFAVVFATMLYAVRRLRQDDLVETLKSESF